MLAWRRSTRPARCCTVLHDVDLELRPGDRVALTGPSGCGKSTVAALLVRVLDPSAGRVTLDGIDLRRLAPERVRRIVGHLPEDAYLFDTTIAANLRVACPEASTSGAGRSRRCGDNGGIAAWAHRHARRGTFFPALRRHAGRALWTGGVKDVVRSGGIRGSRRDVLAAVHLRLVRRGGEAASRRPRGAAG
ncbi:ATP-binding cassette domain-containing protein [Actinoplanes solisilvae]|uniref:ATP-binding cassette domain-containing protein n=1 Tax=Actinoplanes solisilvae TaxID=2486853 RepID=UPI000FDCBCCF|nr:ATP-binding cassette domain-containing protein [Actinoplanes solisilvae]